jgi:hypothetical protein
MTLADSHGTVIGPEDIVRTGMSPSQWDADEPFLRFAKHYLKVAGLPIHSALIRPVRTSAKASHYSLTTGQTSGEVGNGRWTA